MKWTSRNAGRQMMPWSPVTRSKDARNGWAIRAATETNRADQSVVVSSLFLFPLSVLPPACALIKTVDTRHTFDKKSLFKLEIGQPAVVESDLQSGASDSALMLTLCALQMLVLLLLLSWRRHCNISVKCRVCERNSLRLILTHRNWAARDWTVQLCSCQSRFCRHFQQT